MSWIKKWFDFLPKDEDSNQEDKRRKPTPLPNDIEAKVTYRYPKRNFRFPIDLSENTQELKQEINQERRQYERDSNVKQTKNQPNNNIHKRPSESTLEEPAFERKQNTEKPTIDKSPKRPFRPTEIPPPLYGLYKKQGKAVQEEPIVFELTPFFKDEAETVNKDQELAFAFDIELKEPVKTQEPDFGHMDYEHEQMADYDELHSRKDQEELKMDEVAFSQEILEHPKQDIELPYEIDKEDQHDDYNSVETVPYDSSFEQRESDFWESKDASFEQAATYEHDKLAVESESGLVEDDLESESQTILAENDLDAELENVIKDDEAVPETALVKNDFDSVSETVLVEDDIDSELQRVLAEDDHDGFQNLENDNLIDSELDTTNEPFGSFEETNDVSPLNENEEATYQLPSKDENIADVQENHLPTEVEFTNEPVKKYDTEDAKQDSNQLLSNNELAKESLDGSDDTKTIDQDFVNTIEINKVKEFADTLLSESEANLAEHTNEDDVARDFENTPTFEKSQEPIKNAHQAESSSFEHEPKNNAHHSELEQKVENKHPLTTKPGLERPRKRGPIPYNVLMLKKDREILRKKALERQKQRTENKTKPVNYTFPSRNLLKEPVNTSQDQTWLDEQADILNKTFQSFNVDAKVVGISNGPSVTQFEIAPEIGVKVSKITNLTDDLKLSLAAKDIRIEAPIPGKHTIGIEVPNKVARPVYLREILDHSQFRHAESPLTVAMGLDIAGNPIVTDLKKMPHGLIAGATGSGKSVAINTFLVSLLYKARPNEVKLMLIDPKMVELSPYNEIPHLISPVITDSKAATAALQWAVDEMEKRYELLAAGGVRDISKYNEKANDQQKMPYIVIVIDELADLMMVAANDVEEAIARIAQKARACGIHLLIATQRPSVDVITGLIKANIPTRMAFSVSSQIDSRTIIDINGAERLLGKGDMLFLENGTSKPIRIQGAYISDEEIEAVVEHVKTQGEPHYLFEQEQLIRKISQEEQTDELFLEACEYAVEEGNVSTSSLQRRFRIGYNRAARLVEIMEKRGMVSEPKGSKPRDVLLTKEDLEELRKFH